MAQTDRLDRFRAVLSGTARSLSRDSEVEVAFASEGAAAAGKVARVPSPGPGLEPRLVAEARGAADAHALRLRHSNAAMHVARQPGGEGEARAVFDALETARVEALGSRGMPGVSGNLSALAVGRQRAGDRRVVAVADTAHASVDNALHLLGLEALVVPTGPNCRLEGGAWGRAPRSPTPTIVGNAAQRAPARRKNPSSASTMSFSVSAGRSVAVNILYARSAIRMASRIFVTSPMSLTVRSDSTIFISGTNVAFGDIDLIQSRSATESRFPSTATDFTPSFVMMSAAASAASPLPFIAPRP